MSANAEHLLSKTAAVEGYIKGEKERGRFLMGLGSG